MSSDTLPCPIKATWEMFSSGGVGGREGCCVYQWTSDKAGTQYGEGGSAGWRVGIVHPVENSTCV